MQKVRKVVGVVCMLTPWFALSISAAKEGDWIQSFVALLVGFGWIGGMITVINDLPPQFTPLKSLNWFQKAWRIFAAVLFFVLGILIILSGISELFQGSPISDTLVHMAIGSLLIFVAINILWAK